LIHKKSILVVAFIVFTSSSYAQAENNEEAPFTTIEDTIQITPKHSPKKAAFLSAVLPGAGQIYNKKIWKTPIIYAGLGGLGTWIGINAKNLKGYTNAYKLQLDDDPNTIGSYKGISDESQLSIKRDEAKRNLDLSIILTSLFYALNIVDATVDAHLFEYSITEDLSVKIQPEIKKIQAINTSQNQFGINLELSFN